MKIIFDGKEMKVENAEDNIVEVAQKHGVSIIAPCFRNKHKHGGCGACVIEVEGKKAFACGTKPYDGMNIVYDTPELDTLRKERLAIYSDNIKNNTTENNKCSNYDTNCCSSNDSCGESSSNNSCCSDNSGSCCG